jgi:hypothetical protein
MPLMVPRPAWAKSAEGTNVNARSSMLKHEDFIFGSRSTKFGTVFLREANTDPSFIKTW